MYLALDEAAQLPDPAPLLRLMSSMRTTAGVVPKVIMTCNPNNPGSWWVYEHIVSKLVSFQAKHVELFEKKVLLVHSTLFDNSYLADPDSYIETLKASCNGDEAKIASEVFGSWSQISGTFFSSCFSQSPQPDRTAGAGCRRSAIATQSTAGWRHGLGHPGTQLNPADVNRAGAGADRQQTCGRRHRGCGR